MRTAYYVLISLFSFTDLPIVSVVHGFVILLPLPTRQQFIVGDDTRKPLFKRTSVPIASWAYIGFPHIGTSRFESSSSHGQETESDQRTTPSPTSSNSTEDEISRITFGNLLPSWAAQTIDGRLLCAAQCSYEISPAYFRGAGYEPSTVVKRISRGVNSILVGRTFDGITVSFRGTQSNSPLDWLQNAALFLSPVDGEGMIPGKIHTGFLRAVRSLWKPLKSVLKDMIDSYRKDRGDDAMPKIYLTGHSKGGAMASIAALLMRRDPDLPNPTYVCTFGSCRVGNSAFRNVYNKEVTQTSYEAYLDLIPFLPPSESTMESMQDLLTDRVESILWSEKSSGQKDRYVWDYQTVGNRRFITANVRILDEVTEELDHQRIRDIERRTFLSLSEFQAAHCATCPGMKCNGLYFIALAVEICETLLNDNEKA